MVYKEKLLIIFKLSSILAQYLVNKLIAILLFTCFCLMLLGYHLVFNFQLAAVKSEMRAFLKTEKKHKDVVQISLNEKEAKQLYWENENEFHYNGEMYDVIETTKTEDQLVVRCVPDNKETALINEYQKNNKRNHSNSLAVQLITIQFVVPSGFLITSPQKTDVNHFCRHSFALYNCVSAIFIPPPEVG